MALHRAPAPAAATQQAVRQIARCAVRALYAEVALEPKPGLVSLRDNGSHSDMTAATFVKSLFALRHYFGHMARAGALAHPFEFLQALGLGAEERMLAATGGVNTHRGAVFMLGLLCAAAGRLAAKGQPFTAVNLRDSLLRHWGQALRWRAKSAARATSASNGQRAARRFGLRSAGDEAALGFPTLFEVTLPALQAALQAGHAPRAARVQAFFATMAVLDDTNTAHRGGWEGVQFVKTSAQAFLDAGGVAQGDWLRQARAIHADFVARRLSPGGAADVLAAACWLQELQQSAAAVSEVQAMQRQTPAGAGADAAQAQAPFWSGLSALAATHKPEKRRTRGAVLRTVPLVLDLVTGAA
jgi:triphosphoribosyl-dephospho-CoA synthase